MDTPHRSRTAPFVALAALAMGGCALFGRPGVPPPPGVPLSGAVAIWISADQDTYISCGRTANCEEGDLNFGRHSPLAVAGWDLARKRPYAHFDLSAMPPQAEIVEAFVELNHNAQNEDGRTDDLRIPAGEPGAPWNAMTRTWNNSPDRSSPGGPHCLQLKSRAWSSTGNLAADIQGKRGYSLFLNWNYPAASPPIEKGFASNNDASRRQNDLGIAPRLLIRAILPPGQSILSRTTRTFSASEDLGRLPQPVLISMAEATSASPGVWPATWQAAADRCN